jgi:hypothetical protein
VVLTARFTGAIAAVIWFVGAPLVSLAGVPFPSDAQDFLIGAIAALLGLTLAPVTVAVGGAIRRPMKPILRFSGLAICFALVVSGVVLILAVNGRFGERAPDWISLPAFVSFAALFVWISLASIAMRGRSTVERWVFWLGLLTGASLLVTFLGSILMFYFVRDFVITNATVLPLLLFTLLLWLSLPVWLTVVVIRLSERAGG